MLDWFGVALAGLREPLSGILVRELVFGDRGDATLVGHAQRASVLDAALNNGASSHALDFDDTHTLMSGHPSAPVVPAALALAERDGRDGASFLAAFVVGAELECRLGALLNPGHYAAGFHATGTPGTFGAAAAAAHLLALDDGQWRNAIGLAGTQAAGLKSGFGTMAKPLHYPSRTAHTGTDDAPRSVPVWPMDAASDGPIAGAVWHGTRSLAQSKNLSQPSNPRYGFYSPVRFSLRAMKAAASDRLVRFNFRRMLLT